ncbi:hypothetical protein PS850_06161 [Pseudomonas fluorescens]|nr:hypothetical protein PS850_06161 [Pseudomonas fluorescens]
MPMIDSDKFKTELANGLKKDSRTPVFTVTVPSEGCNTMD